MTYTQAIYVYCTHMVETLNSGVLPCILSQLHVQGHYISSLKVAVVGVFTS